MSGQPDFRETRVLMNHLILEKIFPEFGVADLKSCRLVCSKWELMCTPLLMNSSVCAIRNTQLIQRDIAFFHKSFPDSSLVPFTNFRIAGLHLFDHITEFFRDQRYIIKELSLLEVTMFRKVNQQGQLQAMAKFDISTWKELDLEALFLKSGRPSSSSPIPPTKFLVPLSHVGAIKSLVLINCVVILDGGPIAPSKKLEFSGGNFEQISRGRRNGAGDDIAIHLNECIDMKDLEELKLAGITEYENINLDLSKCLRLRHLHISDIPNIEVGWPKFRVLFKNPQLRTVILLKVSLSISDLPPFVEELTVRHSHFPHNKFPFEVPLFPNVKSLDIQGHKEFVRRCPKMRKLVTADFFDFFSLPESARTIKITSPPSPTNCIFGGHLSIEKLVLQYHLGHNEDLKCMDKIIDSLNPKIVVLDDFLYCSYRHSPQNECGDNGEMKREGLFRIVEKQMDAGRTFILRKVACLCNLPESSSYMPSLCKFRQFFPLIPDEYNLCKNGYGIGIAKSTFDHWVNH